MKTMTLLHAGMLLLCAALPAAQAVELVPYAGVSPQFGTPANATTTIPAAVIRARLIALREAGTFSRYNASHAHKVQDALAYVYRDDAAFLKESKGSARLSDGIVGPVTLKWLVRFCQDRHLHVTKADFEQKLMLALEGAMPRQPSTASVTAPPAPERFFGPEVTYRYDPADPSIKKYPADLANRLKPLAQLPRQEREAFRVAVDAKLDGLTDKAELIELIMSVSQVDRYQLSGEILLTLQAAGMTPEAVEDVRALVGRKYNDEASFRDGLESSVLGATDRNSLTLNMPQLVAASRQVLYQVPAALPEDFLAQTTIAEPIITLFSGMRNVEYPNKTLFESARASFLRQALGMCQVQGRPERPIPDDQFATLKPVLPGELFNNIAKLRNLANQRNCQASEQLDALRWDREAYRILVGKLDQGAVTQVTNRVVAPVMRKASWETPDCVCGRTSKSGVVYGFYPLWSRNQQQIDFSQLTRIGLYGMSFDDHGSLQYPLGMDSRGIPLALIDAAHRHTTEVDWVVSRRDWTVWSRGTEQTKHAVLDRLQDEILILLKKPLKNWIGDANALASLGQEPAPTIGDGVTIDFKNFPSNDRKIFNAFILKLSAKLKGQTTTLRLNVMMHSAEMRAHQDRINAELSASDNANMGSDGAYSFTNIIKLIELDNEVKEHAGIAERRRQYFNDINVLVVIDEPTSDSKKLLRGEVQVALHGEKSQRLIRNLIPVMVYGGNKQQLVDDLIYISDNYGGVGFWPLPMKEEKPADDAVQSGANIYDALKHGWYMIHPPSPMEQVLAGVVCPNRVILRWVAWASLLLAVAAVWFFLQCAGCNERLDNSAVYVAIMGAIIMTPFLLLLLLALA